MNLSRLVTSVVDGRRPALIRIIIGTDAAFRGIEAHRVLSTAGDPAKLQLPYFEWLGVPVGMWLDGYILLWVLAAAAFALGWRARWAGLCLSAVMFSSLWFDQRTYSNHLYLLSIIVLLLSLAGAGGSYSLDARLGRRSPVVAEWPITLLKIQLSLVYFFGAVSKINGPYLSGAVLHINLGPGPGGFLALPDGLRTMTVCSVLAWASVVLDLALAIGLWLPRFRVLTVAVGVAFHLSMVSLLTADLTGQLAMFAVACISLYLLFFPPPARSPAQPALA